MVNGWFQVITSSDTAAPGLEMMNEPKVSAIRRITWLGLVSNAFVASFKLAVGLLGHSQVVVADAVHSFSDMVTDAAILLGVGFWTAAADEKHPYGHGKFESVITAMIGLFLAYAGADIAYDGLISFKNGGAHAAPALFAVWGPVVSIIVKEVVFRLTMREARRTGSTALIANAWHHRSDVMSSLPALAAVAAAVMFPGFGFVDSIGAVVVSVFIIKSAWDIIRMAFDELTDRSVSPELVEDLKVSALSIDGVRGLHAIRTRSMGGGIYVDMHVLVDGGMTVAAGHDIAAAVKVKLKESHDRVDDVLVHIEPCE